jgi:hypothetical protein
MFLSKYWAKICKKMPDKMYLMWQFWHIYHRKLNIENPVTYADKLAYLKTHDHNMELSKLVDKYEVREYVSQKIGKEYLVPLVGVYNSTDEIPWNELPEKYVLKCTHDSASVILHLSNEGFNGDNAIKSLNKHLSRNMFWYSREYPYKYVTPRIVCETFLDDNGKPPADYKIMCFDGKPKYIVLDMDRFGDHKRDVYDLNWNKQDLSTDHAQSNVTAERPEALDKMIELAAILSEGFPHVRVDFYYVNGKIYFGEMTFFPWGGPIWFKPDKWNYILGELIPIK